MRNGQDGSWTEADVPVQRGRTAVITGANTGLGFETAAVLGPVGRGELRGYPRLVASTDRARDTGDQQRLWRESERLTGVTYPV